jgi:hypothetical protein
VFAKAIGGKINPFSEIKEVDTDLGEEAGKDLITTKIFESASVKAKVPPNKSEAPKK